MYSTYFEQNILFIFYRVRCTSLQSGLMNTWELIILKLYETQDSCNIRKKTRVNNIVLCVVIIILYRFTTVLYVVSCFFEV